MQNLGLQAPIHIIRPVATRGGRLGEGLSPPGQSAASTNWSSGNVYTPLKDCQYSKLINSINQTLACQKGGAPNGTLVEKVATSDPGSKDHLADKYGLKNQYQKIKNIQRVNIAYKKEILGLKTAQICQLNGMNYNSVRKIISEYNREQPNRVKSRTSGENSPHKQPQTSLAKKPASVLIHKGRPRAGGPCPRRRLCLKIKYKESQDEGQEQKNMKLINEEEVKDIDNSGKTYIILPDFDINFENNPSKVFVGAFDRFNHHNLGNAEFQTTNLSLPICEKISESLEGFQP